MAVEEIDIILIRGAPGSGKSEVSKSLSATYPNGIRMEIDLIRSMVISVDWTKQEEHINILQISTNLVFKFLELGFKPIIVVDTFSGNKILKYISDLHILNNSLKIKVIALYTTEDELKKRIETRLEPAFKNLPICLKLNKETLKNTYNGEIRIDTTNLDPNDVVKIILPMK